MTEIDKGALEKAAMAVCIAAGYEPETWADNEELRDRCRKYASVAIDAHRNATAPSQEPHGMPGVEAIADAIIAARKLPAGCTVNRPVFLQDAAAIRALFSEAFAAAVDKGRDDLMQHIRMLEGVTREQAAEIERAGTYFANKLGREWIGPDGVRYEPTRKRASEDVEF